tara:strand:+ start:554 stop:2221 length:1668 start_codon:yes stop_codon:yes gene_type:complete
MLKKFLSFISTKKIVYRYKRINKKIFNNNFSNSNTQILVEFNAFHSDHIILSYLSNYLSKKYKSKIVGFYNFSLLISELHYGLIKSLKWSLSKLLKYRNFSIYYSFGVSSIFRPKISKNQQTNALKIFKTKFNKIKSNKDIYKFEINKIPFGDLIYDTYLKRFYVPTINVKDKKFKNFLLEFIELILFWEEYFKNNNVKAVVGVHAQYSYGVVHRIAVFKNKICLLHAEGRIYKITKKYLFQHNEFKFYRDKFKKLSSNYKKQALKMGNKVLINRIKGATGTKSGQTYISHSSFSTFKKNKTKNILKQNKKLNILITTQDFFDSVNGYGKTLFSDIYEWMEFCGKLSDKTEFNWYIKDHPNYAGKYQKYQPFTENITDEICKKYKNLIKLPSNTSHNQLINEGVNFVLTMYGSVQFEYPYFDIPVLTASKNTPTINYNFCIHSKNLREYEKNILKLTKKKIKVDKKQIKEFYFMNFVFHNQDIVYPLYTKFNKINKKWDLYWSEKFYKYWCDNFNNKQHLKVFTVIDNFVKSNDITVNITHLNDKNIFKKDFKKL